MISRGLGKLPGVTVRSYHSEGTDFARFVKQNTSTPDKLRDPVDRMPCGDKTISDLST